LDERAQRLEFELAQYGSARELCEKQGIPRLLWVESEFRRALREAELEYVRKLSGEISNGALEGVDWWRDVHEHPDRAVTPPPFAPGAFQEFKTATSQ
jgi:hypothetical protein